MKYYSSFLIPFLFIVVFYSCKKKTDDSCPACPAVTSLNPSQGHRGDTITLTGINFDATLSGNQVKFNGTTVPESDMISGSTTQLVVKVPPNCGTGAVTVYLDAELFSETGPAFTYLNIYTVSTIAGDGNYGFIDSTGMNAEFALPMDVAADNNGNIYVADANNNKIRKIDNVGNVSTIAGGSAGFQDGYGIGILFNQPWGIVLNGNSLLIADTYNSRIRSLSMFPFASTIAGGASAGFLDGNDTASRLSYPTDLVMDNNQNIYVADQANERIRKISSTNVVTTLAGNGIRASLDGQGTAAEFYDPMNIAIDRQNNLYVTDYTGNKIRKITPGGLVTTIAGTGTAGYVDGPAALSQFNSPRGIAVDKYGNIFIGDAGNSVIRKIDLSGNVTTIAGDGTTGWLDGAGPIAKFYAPAGIAFDKNGNLIVAERLGYRIRKITIE